MKQPTRLRGSWPGCRCRAHRSRAEPRSGLGHHATEFDQAWARFDQQQLSKLRAWAPQFLGDAYTDTAPMFYMFSGPDFLYANALFPNASVYILCGTEPVGPVPDIAAIPPEALPSALANLRKSLDSVLSWSFFVTKNMKVDLAQKQLSGTLPVLYVFLARAGYVIDSVTPVGLDRSGALTDPGKGKTPGVKIVFLGAGGIPRRSITSTPIWKTTPSGPIRVS